MHKFSHGTTAFSNFPLRGGGRVCTQIGPNRKCSQKPYYLTCSDRSRRAEHFLPRNLVSKTLPDKVLSSYICDIVVRDSTISHSLYLNRSKGESRHLLPVHRADPELQKRAQTWSKKCWARVLALFYTDGSMKKPTTHQSIVQGNSAEER